MTGRDVEAEARAIIDEGRYMTLATADESGVPWASPVWYAPQGDRELFWASKPEARHSRNLAARPELAIVIFDSSRDPGTAQAVYVSAVGGEVAGDELEHGLEVYNRRSLDQGLPEWTLDDVRPPARHRLYRATVTELFVLDQGDSRTAVTLPP